MIMNQSKPRREQRDKKFTGKVKREVDFNTLFKRFKRDTKKNGIVQECLDRQHYVKSSEKRKCALEKAVKRERKRNYDRNRYPIFPSVR
jgi:ribosomal protein S21